MKVIYQFAKLTKKIINKFYKTSIKYLNLKSLTIFNQLNQLPKYKSMKNS
jgi:hypothetical protein